MKAKFYHSRMNELKGQLSWLVDMQEKGLHLSEIQLAHKTYLINKIKELNEQYVLSKRCQSLYVLSKKEVKNPMPPNAKEIVNQAIAAANAAVPPTTQVEPESADPVVEGLTPKALAAELGIDAKQVRRILREKYHTLADQQASTRRWNISDEAAQYVRDTLAKRSQPNTIVTPEPPAATARAS